MSNSVRPHRRQPTRLRRPWDSPRKNTGVGCHFLLQCIKVKSESEVAQSCPTLSNPMGCSLPGSSVHGVFQARVLEWVAIAHYHHINTTYDCFMCYQLFNLFFLCPGQQATKCRVNSTRICRTTPDHRKYLSLALNQTPP